jgi:hypothetical protein
MWNGHGETNDFIRSMNNCFGRQCFFVIGSLLCSSLASQAHDAHMRNADKLFTCRSDRPLFESPASTYSSVDMSGNASQIHDKETLRMPDA